MILLTGFLGSGKTSLLGRLLRDPALSDTAVLINEFGEIGLDHHLLERIDETVVLLRSGCVCCTIRGELSEAIAALHSRRARGEVAAFRRLVIETTGLADPLPVMTTVAADPMLRHHFRMGAVVTTVDAVNGREQLAAQSESVAQVAVADRIVLTKTDIADPSTRSDLIRTIRTINPAATLTVSAEAFDAEMLLSECRVLPAVIPSRPMRGLSGHAAEVSSLAIFVDHQLDWTVFGLWLTMLLHRHGDRILRVKCLLNVEGAEGPVAVHGVQQLVHVPTHLSRWPDADRRSKLVFITRGLDPTLIERSMRAFNLLH
ncbi:GTP-binding protein [Sphingosinicellaceae bacterium]|nr:GTP-binding protein [Sphingosinicellaceae bacterium]